DARIDVHDVLRPPAHSAPVRSWCDGERVFPEQLGAAFQANRVVEDDAVLDDMGKQLLDVLRNDVVAVVEKRPGARRPLERKRSAYRRSDSAESRTTRRSDEGDDPPLELPVDEDLLDRSLEPGHLGDRHRRAEAVERMSAPLVVDDPELLF